MSIPCTAKERVAMVRLFSKFENAHEVQRQWKYHFDTCPSALATILAVNQMFEERGSVEDLQPRGRRNGYQQFKLIVSARFCSGWY
jgi:hypothetical protein